MSQTRAARPKCNSSANTNTARKCRSSTTVTISPYFEPCQDGMERALMVLLFRPEARIGGAQGSRLCNTRNRIVLFAWTNIDDDRPLFCVLCRRDPDQSPLSLTSNISIISEDLTPLPFPSFRSDKALALLRLPLMDSAPT